MEKHIVQFFKFLEDKEGKSIPLKVKISHPKVFGKLRKEDLNVKSDLNLSKTNIKELPQGLEVGRTLWLDGCTSLKKLPEGLKVGKNLWLDGCTSLEKLPEGLKVGKNLYLMDTPISKKYSEEQIRSMIEDGGGYVNARIVM